MCRNPSSELAHGLSFGLEGRGDSHRKLPLCAPHHTWYPLLQSKTYFPPWGISFPKSRLTCVSLGKGSQGMDRPSDFFHECSPVDASGIPSPPEAPPPSCPRWKQQQLFDSRASSEILISVGSTLEDANTSPSASLWQLHGTKASWSEVTVWNAV